MNPEPVRPVEFPHFSSPSITDADSSPDLKQTVNLWHETDTRSRMYHDHVNDIVFAVTPDGEIKYIAPNTMRHLGYSPEELIGTSFVPLVHPDDVAICLQYMLQTLEEGTTRELDCRVRHKNGTFRWFATTGAKLPPGPDGQVLLVGSARDISERKRIEEEMRQYAWELEQSRNQIARQAEDLREANERAQQASRAKSEFLANMSHEIRTPMTAILGYASLLQIEDIWVQDRARRLEALDAIRCNGEHLLSIINDILDLSKIEAGRMELETMSCDVRRLVDDVASALQIRAVDKGLSLSAELAWDVPQVVGTDPTRVRQILMNLIGNAIKFTEKGSVRIKVDHILSDNVPQIRFQISDTGIGIDPAGIENLFLPFTQADAQTSRRFGGTGLGLTISRRLAELLGGSLTAVSELGRGSVFTATIGYRAAPAENESAEGSRVVTSTAPERITSQSLEGCQILLVEDGIDNQRLIAFLLRRAGAIVEIAGNGQIALDMIDAAERKGTRLDLILMDMQMPVMDGYTTTRRLRERGDKRPIIALTANSMSGDRQHCLDTGCNDYIPKPIDRSLLLSVVCRWNPLAVG